MLGRRKFLAGGSLLLAGLAGCLGSDDDDDAVPIDDYRFELSNNTDQRHEFHYAFETPDGLEEWTAQTVDANTGELITYDTSELSDVVALHAFVAVQPASADLREYERSDVILIEYGNRDAPRILGFPEDE